MYYIIIGFWCVLLHYVFPFIPVLPFGAWFSSVNEDENMSNEACLHYVYLHPALYLYFDILLLPSP